MTWCERKLSPRSSERSASPGPSPAPRQCSAAPSPGQPRWDVRNQSSPFHSNISKHVTRVFACLLTCVRVFGSHSDLDREAKALAGLTSRLQEHTPALLTVGLVQKSSRRKTPLIQRQTVPDGCEEEEEEEDSSGSLTQLIFTSSSHTALTLQCEMSRFLHVMLSAMRHKMNPPDSDCLSC